MQSIAVDFDGVIHKYSEGWKDGSIYDVPIKDAIEGIRRLQKQYAVFIHTTRDPSTVAIWLSDHGLNCVIDVEGPNHRREFWTDQGTLLITQRKLPAIAYIDDRAYLFRSWDSVVEDFIPGAD